MEYWDIYDAQRRKTGRTMIRGEKMKDDEYHLVVHICIFNEKNEMLIQQRQAFKDGWPNLWDVTVGGSAIKGETSQEAAERELFEELDIQINLQGIRPQLTVNFERGFDDIYLVEKEVQPEDIKFQYEEVQGTKWASKEEILNSISAGEFIPYLTGFIDLLFDMRMKYGCIRLDK